MQVAWIHIDRQMILTIDRHVISRVPRFSVSHDTQQTWSLHVKNAEAEDRGYYMCQVNTNPMISQVGYLQVVGTLYLFYSFTFSFCFFCRQFLKNIYLLEIIVASYCIYVLTIVVLCHFSPTKYHRWGKHFIISGCERKP